MAEAAPRESTTAWGSSPSETCNSGGPEELSMAANLRLTAAAAAELGRQAAVAGTPGQMHLDLTPGECAQHVCCASKQDIWPALRSQGPMA